MNRYTFVNNPNRAHLAEDDNGEWVLAADVVSRFGPLERAATLAELDEGRTPLENAVDVLVETAHEHADELNRSSDYEDELGRRRGANRFTRAAVRAGAYLKHGELELGPDALDEGTIEALLDAAAARERHFTKLINNRPAGTPSRDRLIVERELVREADLVLREEADAAAMFGVPS